MGKDAVYSRPVKRTADNPVKNSNPAAAGAGGSDKGSFAWLLFCYQFHPKYSDLVLDKTMQPPVRQSKCAVLPGSALLVDSFQFHP